jgi:hypothetical protein
MGPGVRRDDETHLNAQFSGHSSRRIQSLPASLAEPEEGDVMERRHFLKLAVGIAAGTAALAVGAQAAPLSPRPLGGDEHLPSANQDVHSAVTTEAEVEHLRPEEVRWGHHWHHHWHRRWHWHRRHWGWHRRHW